MTRNQWSRISWFVLVSVAFLLLLPRLSMVPQGLGFSLFHVCWPVLFFAAGLSGGLTWPLLTCGLAAGIALFSSDTAYLRPLTAIAAALMVVSYFAAKGLDLMITRVSNSTFADYLSGKTSKFGNLAPVVIPIAAVIFGERDLNGYAGRRPELLAFGILYYLVGAMMSRREILLEAIAHRWIFKVLGAFVFSALLALAHYRLSVGSLSLVPAYSVRRAIYGLAYAYLSWRWCYGLAGWSRGKHPLAQDPKLGAVPA